MRARIIRVALALLLFGCIPADDTAPSGAIFIDAVAEPTTTKFTTDDGWAIVIEKAVTPLRPEYSAGTNYDEISVCDPKGNGDRAALVDLTNGHVFRGLGIQIKSCLVGLTFDEYIDQQGDADSGLDAAEIERFMYSGEYAIPHGSARMHLVGRAVRGAEIKQFDLMISSGNYIATNSPRASAMVVANSKTDVRYGTHLDQIFRVTNESSSNLRRFDAIAAADRDGDGTIVTDELQFPISEIDPAYGEYHFSGLQAYDAKPPTFANFLASQLPFIFYLIQ